MADGIADDMTSGTTGGMASERAAMQAGKPHSARVWNYWIGGKDFYEVDKELGDQVIATYPQTRDLARASRAFQARAVRYLAREAGVRQFLDIGTGLPTANSTHEVAQAVAPDARIVYVDNDPLVLAHANALLTSTPEGSTDYVEADLLDAATVLEGAAKTLDLSQPVAVMLLSTLGHIEAGPAIELVQSYLAGVGPGSHLVVCDTVSTPATLEAQAAYASGDTPAYLVREPDEILGCAKGLDLLEPGFGSISLWRPEEPVKDPVDQWGLVGIKR